MITSNQPKTLAQIERDTLAAQSVDRAIAAIKRANLLHRTEEAREECYQVILNYLSQWISREDLECYLSLNNDFALPQWLNYRGEHYPIGVWVNLTIPGHTEINCLVNLQKPWGYSIQVVSHGNWFARGNPFTYLGEALVSARNDWLYQHGQESHRQEYETTTRTKSNGPSAIEMADVEETEIPF